MRLNYWAHDFMDLCGTSGRNSMITLYIERRERYCWRQSAWECLLPAYLLFTAPKPVYAYTATAGTINDGPVKVRNAPVTGDKLTLLYPGNAVTVTDETAGSDGYTWYQIQMSDGVTGYIRSDFVTLQGTDSSADRRCGQRAGGTNGWCRTWKKVFMCAPGAGNVYSVVTKVYKGQAVNVGELVSAGGMNWYSVTLVVGGASYSGGFVRTM